MESPHANALVKWARAAMLNDRSFQSVSLGESTSLSRGGSQENDHITETDVHNSSEHWRFSSDDELPKGIMFWSAHDVPSHVNPSVEILRWKDRFDVDDQSRRR
jgi:hypothetical protein